MKKVLRAAALLPLAAMMLSVSSFAQAAAAHPQEGAVLYQDRRCPGCHESAIVKNVPPLRKTQMTQQQIEDLLTKGSPGKKAPHNKPIAGLKASQAAAISAYVVSLKK